MRWLVLVMVVVLVGCRERAPRRDAPVRPSPGEAPAHVGAEPPQAAQLRAALVGVVRAGGVRDARVLEVMGRVERHRFVPEASLSEAYEDRPLPIGHGQTISQPGVVATMTEALRLTGYERVLEIGTGSGYQAAVLALMAKEVYSIEIVPQLGEMARERLATLGYGVKVRIGDGYRGWPEAAPFDRIILTAAPEEIPKALLDQLADGGILVAPVGEEYRAQQLVRVTRKGDHYQRELLAIVRFVPMVSERPATGSAPGRTSAPP